MRRRNPIAKAVSRMGTKVIPDKSPRISKEDAEAIRYAAEMLESDEMLDENDNIVKSNN